MNASVNTKMWARLNHKDTEKFFAAYVTNQTDAMLYLRELIDTGRLKRNEVRAFVKHMIPEVEAVKIAKLLR